MDNKKTYTPTGNWEVYSEWDSNWETVAPVLVRPDGTIDDFYEPTDLGRSEARGWADTYNMNEDKGARFDRCPYCTTGCPWCD